MWPGSDAMSKPSPFVQPSSGAGKCRGRRGSTGFSLLEILVAFTILAISLSIILQIFGGGTRSLRVGDEYRRAAMVGESVLAQVGHTLAKAPGEQSGESGGFRWRLSVSPYVDETWPELGEGLLLVQVDVAWAGPVQDRHLTLSTLEFPVRELTQP